MDKIEKIKNKFHSIAFELGYELVELTGLKLGGRSVIRAYIYKLGGVSIKDCKTLSNAYSDYLDIEDPIGGNFTLEVSSLGLDRPLKSLDDFKRRIGEKVSLELEPDSYHKSLIEGKLLETDEAGITILYNDEKLYFELDRVIRGKTIY